MLTTYPKLNRHMDFYYFIGIDIAKDTLDWAVCNQHGLQFSTHLPNTLAGIKSALAELKALPDWNPKQAVFCMEHTAQAALRHLQCPPAGMASPAAFVDLAGIIFADQAGGRNAPRQD